VAVIPTPLGEIAMAPPSGDAPAVLLWVVTFLVGVLAVVCLLMWRMIQANAEACRKENAKAQEAADEARREAKAEAAASASKVEKLYEKAVEQFAQREARLTEVVQANTAALKELTEIGSGYYRAVREEREKGDRDARRRHSTNPG
jgi:hypothetical protein